MSSRGDWLPLVGLPLGLSAARGTVRRPRSKSRIGDLSVADVMDAEPVAIADDATVERALDEFFLRYRWPWFPVTDATQRFVGLIVREAADAVPDSDRATRLVGDVARSRLGGDASGRRRTRPLDSLLGNDALRRFGALAAVDPDGRLRGIVTAEQIGRALRDAMSEPPPAT